MVPKELILISDPRVLSISIQENSDPLVDLRKFDLNADLRKSGDSTSYFKLRKSVVEKLSGAQGKLPSSIKFLIVEGLRPLSLQKEYFGNYSNELIKLHPSWDEQKVYEEASKYIAPPEIHPPHSTGGAVDLTLIRGVKELDMGTQLNADPEASKNACFTLAENISDQAKQNRKILINALSEAGFVNYVTEWWHWSYGDRYWAYNLRKPFAIFDSIEAL